MLNTLDLIPLRLARTIARLRMARLAYLTERTIRAMPDHIRRDMGWPDIMQDKRFRE